MIIRMVARLVAHNPDRRKGVRIPGAIIYIKTFSELEGNQIDVDICGKINLAQILLPLLGLISLTKEPVSPEQE